MKNSVLILFLLLSFTQTIFSQEYDFTIPLSETGKRGTLSVDVKKGPITIKGTNRQDIYVKYKSTDEGGEKGKETMKNGMKKIGGAAAGLEAGEQDNKVYIESESWNKGIVLYVEVPRGFDLEVQSYNDGDINIDNIAGKVAIETYNGSITAKNMEGSVVANTYNGPVIVTFTKITAGTPMNFVTFNGDVDITLPTDAKANLKMKSEQGDVYTDFDMQVTKPAISSEKKEGKTKTFVSGWVTGAINGGGAEFSMQNYNGDIYIRKK